MAKQKYNILYVYNETQRNLRATVKDLIWAFDRHSGQRCFYFNTIGPSVPDYLLSVKFDIIVFNALFLGQRNNPPSFVRARKTVQALRDIDCVKIAMPQDEYMHCDLLCEFINDFRITHVLSLGSSADWPEIYANVDRDRVKFNQILAGYLEPSTVARIERILKQARDRRPLDVGYRAWYAPPWLGRRALVKGRIADVFRDAAPEAGLTVDIETDLDKVFAGDDWYRFLASCRFALGAEGGSGIADRDGSLRSRTQEFIRANPQASFDDIEAACFPGVDGRMDHFMITPRHLECCVTSTGQVLVEGDYNGILQPEVHYIPVKRDFSNVKEVLEKMRNEGLRRQMVDRAHRDIVAPGRFTYRHHIQGILTSVAPNIPRRSSTAYQEARSVVVQLRLRLHMAIIHWLISHRHLLARYVRQAEGKTGTAIVRRLPQWMQSGIRRLLRGKREKARIPAP